MDGVSYSKVYLTPRDSVPVRREVKNVDWDGLVEEVFKEEVDQFFIESGVESLHIEHQTNTWCRKQPSNSASQRGTSSSSSSLYSLSPSFSSPSSMSSTPSLSHTWTNPDSQNTSRRQGRSSSSTTGQSWWQKNQSTSPAIKENHDWTKNRFGDGKLVKKQEDARTHGFCGFHKL